MTFTFQRKSEVTLIFRCTHAQSETSFPIFTINAVSNVHLEEEVIFTVLNIHPVTLQWLLLVSRLILFSRHFFTEPLSESFHKTWLLSEDSLDRNWNSWSEIPNLWLIVTADCVYIVLWAPLSHRIVIKTLSRHYFLLILSCWVELFFPRSSKNTSNFRLFPFLPAVTTDNYSPYLPFTLPLSQHCLTSISTLSTLSHFHLNTAHTDTLPQTLHIRDWFFSLVISQWSSLRLPKLYFWLLDPKKYEPQPIRAVGLVHLEKNSVCNRENVSAHYQYLSYVIHPPCNFTVLEQEIHGYLNPMSGKTDIETIVMNFA